MFSKNTLCTICVSFDCCLTLLSNFFPCSWQWILILLGHTLSDVCLPRSCRGQLFPHQGAKEPWLVSCRVEERVIRTPSSSLRSTLSWKDVLNFLFPDGWQCTQTLDDSSDGEVLDLSDPDASPVCSAERVKEFYVNCDRCTKRTYAAKRTEYTNVGDHALRCYGKEEIFDTIKVLRKEL